MYYSSFLMNYFFSVNRKGPKHQDYLFQYTHFCFSGSQCELGTNYCFCKLLIKTNYTLIIAICQNMTNYVHITFELPCLEGAIEVKSNLEFTVTTKS